MRLIFAHILLLIGSGSALCQSFPEKGVPFMQNFSPSDFEHKGKVWNMDTAPNGIIYMATDKGLLEYDGSKWKHFEGSDGVIRSVSVINDSLIYSGSDRDFGVWKRNIYNDFEYTSLYPFKEDLNQINEEFWGVHPVNNYIFFVSSNNIYAYKDGNLTKITLPELIQNSFVFDDRLHLVAEENGLYQLQDLSPERVIDFSGESDIEIIDMYQSPAGIVIVSKNNGLLQYESNKLTPLDIRLSDILRSANVFSFERIGESKLAFGTVLEGLLISDVDGQVIHHIDKNKGLQNNTVLSLNYTRDGKLWAGLDYGVSVVDLKSEYSFFYDYQGQFGTGYSAVLKEGVFYLGTNQGVYKSSWEGLNNDTDFKNIELIPGSEGQAWEVRLIDEEILIGHDRGLLKIMGNNIKRLGQQKGVLTMSLYEKNLLVGTYNGISIFKKVNGQWTFEKQMEQIFGSVNQIIVSENGELWVNIPNYGVVKVILGPDLKPAERKIFQKEQFQGSDLKIKQNNDNIQIQTNSHTYTHNADSGTFSKSNSDLTDASINKMFIPHAQPVQLNERYSFYPVYNGFALKDITLEQAPDSNSLSSLVFRRVEAFTNDDLVEIHNGVTLSNQFNNLRIEVIVPNRRNVSYQYKKNRGEAWSDWQKEGEIELVGLGSDDYSIHVRANIDGNIITSEALNFSIAAPWYLSRYAYLSYALSLLFFGYLIYRWQNRTLNMQKRTLLLDQRTSLRRQKEKHEIQLQAAEEEKLKAEYERLKAQLRSKTVELATKAKENDEKNKILKKLRDKIKQIEENPDSVKRKSAEIKKVIESHIDEDDNTFEIQIDELHQEFFESLRQKFSDLTRYDLRLCAYIKIGFDSKEIADLLNIKPSSVYISRSRLRKKLNIETDEDLHSYLNSI